MSWRDPKFTYHGVATHADPGAFARRMKARRREVQEAVKAREENARLSARSDELEARLAGLIAAAEKSAPASGSRAKK